MHRIGPTEMVFVQFEIRQTLVPAPTAITCDVCPLVVIARLSAHINHAVDTRTTAEHLASWIFQTTPVQPRIWRRVVEPVCARITNAIQIAHRNMDPVVIVFASRFDQ